MITGMTKRFKIQLGILAVVLAAAAALFVHATRDPLAKFTADDEIEVGAAEQKYISHILGLIEKNNMAGMYREMANMRRATFVGRFAKGLFKEPDFCPAIVVGAARKRITRENNVDIYVKSERRNKVYCFSLLGIKNGFRIGNILETDDKRFKNK